MIKYNISRAGSSVGRAPRSQRGGRGFDSPPVQGLAGLRNGVSRVISRYFYFFWIVFFGIYAIFFSARFLSGAEQDSTYLVIPIQDKIISPPLAEFVERQVQSGQGYSGIIFLIDTPGGFLSSTEKIVKAILGSNVPTVAFIYPKGAKAGSAGVFIAFACDMVVMAPSTRIGAAHPVIFNFGWKSRDKRRSFYNKDRLSKAKGWRGADDKEENLRFWNDEEIVQEKVLNDVLAMFRSYLRVKHPNASVEMCEDLVRRSRSFTDAEAMENHLVDGVCNDLDEVISLAEKKGLFVKRKGRKLVWARMKGMDLFMYYLTNPYLLYLLSSMSILLLLFEITHPGFGIPGIMGLVGLGLVSYGYGFLPVNFLGLFLFALGVAFCIAEPFVAGFGLLIGSGILLMIWGSVLMWKHPDSLFRFEIRYIIPFIFVFSASIVAIIWLALKIKRQPPLTGISSMIGRVADVVEDVSPMGGKVFCMGEYWNARTKEGKVERGKRVEVIGVEGLELIVKERRE